MKGRPSGYEWSVRGKEVVITHHGVVGAVLRGPTAHQFVRDAEHGDQQLLMARVVTRGTTAPAKKPPRKR
ncbi:hypothetical protein [Aeromicrobium sp. P5_D10]